MQVAVSHVPGPNVPQSLTHSARWAEQSGVGPVQSNVAALVHGVCPSPHVHAMRTPESPQAGNVVVVVVLDVVVVVDAGVHSPDGSQTPVERVPPFAPHVAASTPGPSAHTAPEEVINPEQQFPGVPGGLTQVPVAPSQTVPGAPGVPPGGGPVPLQAAAEGAYPQNWPGRAQQTSVVVVVVLVVVVLVVLVVVGQGPQSMVPPQPSESIPQSWAPHVVGVQHLPNSFFARPGGGVGLTHRPPQQLMFVAHCVPSRLHPPSDAASRDVLKTRAMVATSPRRAAVARVRGLRVFGRGLI